MNVLPLHEYEIVGATLSADDNELPVRLRPVLRTRHEPHTYALLYERDGEERLVPEDQASADELLSAQRFHAFAVPLPAQPGYWLVQFGIEAALEYLPREGARERIREEGARALEQSERALIEGDLARARARAAYAARALEDDPFPRLALIALWRHDADEGQLAYLSRPLRPFHHERIRQRFRDAQQRRATPNLIERIWADRLRADYGLVPSWLPARPSGARAMRQRSPASLFGAAHGARTAT